MNNESPLEEVPQDEPVSDKVTAYEAFKNLDIGTEGFEMPRLGNKNCSWCYGKGFAMINKQIQVCKCLRPKSEEEHESQIGRLKQVKPGKHAKGRTRYNGKKGTWKMAWKRWDEMTDSERVSSTPHLKWKFFYSN